MSDDPCHPRCEDRRHRRGSHRWPRRDALLRASERSIECASDSPFVSGGDDAVVRRPCEVGGIELNSNGQPTTSPDVVAVPFARSAHPNVLVDRYQLGGPRGAAATPGDRVRSLENELLQPFYPVHVAGFWRWVPDAPACRALRDGRNLMIRKVRRPAAVRDRHPLRSRRSNLSPAGRCQGDPEVRSVFGEDLAARAALGKRALGPFDCFLQSGREFRRIRQHVGGFRRLESLVGADYVQSRRRGYFRAFYDGMGHS